MKKFLVAIVVIVFMMFPASAIAQSSAQGYDETDVLSHQSSTLPTTGYTIAYLVIAALILGGTGYLLRVVNADKT